MSERNVEIFGRKTFFVAADASLIPEAYLEEFMMMGYQAHVVPDDYRKPLAEKIESIAENFPDSIVFFNIDSQVEGIEWRKFVPEFMRGHPKILVGILFLKRNNADEELAMKRHFVRDLRIQSGCIPLEPRGQENFSAILKVLEQSGARGRRELIRAECDQTSAVTFSSGGSSYSARLVDLNLSHFLRDVRQGLDSFPIFTKVDGVRFKVNGREFESSAVLIMKRSAEGKNLGVFMLVNPDGGTELDGEFLKSLNRKIFQIVSEKTMKLLER